MGMKNDDMEFTKLIPNQKNSSFSGAILLSNLYAILTTHCMSRQSRMN